MGRKPVSIQVNNEQDIYDEADSILLPEHKLLIAIFEIYGLFQHQANLAE